MRNIVSRDACIAGMIGSEEAGYRSANDHDAEPSKASCSVVLHTLEEVIDVDLD